MSLTVKTYAKSTHSHRSEIRLLDIFEIPCISNEKFSILIEIPNRISYLVFGIKNFETLGFSHLELEILGILSEITNNLKTWNFN